ncbi:MAG: hypothetical protein QY323_06155 [Patescibacteria group bacterium]|nr:MAG: hypothetical protein QY323_06155 [Patescibacteria group bacterium]
MENLTFDLDELYGAVKERALSEGAYTPEEWSDVIDMTLQDREEFGEVHDDEELSAVKEQLKARFEEFKSEIPEA